MIRLKDIITEGLFSNPDDRANHIANHLFGSEYKLTNRQPNPKDVGEIIYTFSNGLDTQRIARLPRHGNISWYLRKNDMWDKISVKSIPIPPPSPEELDIQSKRQLNRDKREKWEQEQEDAARRKQEAAIQARNAKFPNFEIDWNSNTTGDTEKDELIMSALNEREQKVIFMRHKGYTTGDLAQIFNVSPTRITQIYTQAIQRLKSKIATREFEQPIKKH